MILFYLLLHENSQLFWLDIQLPHSDNLQQRGVIRCFALSVILAIAQVLFHQWTSGSWGHIFPSVPDNTDSSNSCCFWYGN